MSKAPKIEINRHAHPLELSWKLSNVHVSIANAIRRSIPTMVRTMALECVEVQINHNTVMSETMLGHRLGLIPLVAAHLPRACSCERGCIDCAPSFELDIENNTHHLRDITAADLIPSATNTIPIRVVNPNDPITVIGFGQRIKLIAWALVGKGEDHAQWNPGVTSMVPMARIRVNKNLLNSTQRAQVAAICPQGVFSSDLDVEELPKCTICQRCSTFTETEFKIRDAIAVDSNMNEFLFKVEDNGSLTAAESTKQGLLELKSFFAAKRGMIETLIKVQANRKNRTAIPS